MWSSTGGCSPACVVAPLPGYHVRVDPCTFHTPSPRLHPVADCAAFTTNRASSTRLYPPARQPPIFQPTPCAFPTHPFTHLPTTLPSLSTRNLLQGVAERKREHGGRGRGAGRNGNSCGARLQIQGLMITRQRCTDPARSRFYCHSVLAEKRASVAHASPFTNIPMHEWWSRRLPEVSLMSTYIATYQNTNIPTYPHPSHAASQRLRRSPEVPLDVVAQEAALLGLEPREQRLSCSSKERTEARA